MKRTFLACFFALCSNFLLAQTQETYFNSSGDQHLAGPFDQKILQTDSVFKVWFDSFSKEFQLSGKNTDWKRNLENTEVEIFLGTWCGDSKRWVPQFIQLWKELGLNQNQLKFIALYDGKEFYKQGPNGEEKGKLIHRVPTFIFKKEGTEYARIVEYPINDLETDLAQIALGFDSKPNYRAATYLLELFERESLDSIYKNVQTHFNEVYRLVSKEKELNTLGYVFQYSNRMPQALLTFEINSVIFPYSPGILNSYGDALLANGQKERATEIFKRILEIEPTFGNAVEQLKKLSEESKEP